MNEALDSFNSRTGYIVDIVRRAHGFCCRHVVRAKNSRAVPVLTSNISRVRLDAPGSQRHQINKCHIW